MIGFLSRNWLFRRWFGEFSEAELRKFVFLGVIFALVIGVYWTFRPLKDSIFSSMVHDPAAVATNPKATGAYIPWAKIFSLLVLFPIVILYGKATEKFEKYRLFYLLGFIYSCLTLAFGLYFTYSPNGLVNTVGDPHRYIAWFWYVFVESFGSLMVALFWAFVSDISTPESAKRGFSLVVMIGQLGAILGPLLLVKKETGLAGFFSNSGPVVLFCVGLILLVMFSMKLFMTNTPKEQLIGYQAKDEAKVEASHEPGFLEGLRLMLSEKYLLGIFGIIAIYEILATIIDFNFKSAVMAVYATEAARSSYLGDYAIWVNLVSFICLVLGVGNIQRYLGTKFSLALMPFIILGLIILFMAYGNVAVLFWIMIFVKAINYALNGPTMKQLYVPTTEDVKYKSQAWIETFGSRSSKAFGSSFNIVSARLGSYFIPALTVLAFGLGGVWLVIALYLGNTYQKAVDEKRVVC